MRSSPTYVLDRMFLFPMCFLTLSSFLGLREIFSAKIKAHEHYIEYRALPSLGEWSKCTEYLIHAYKLP